MKIEHFLSEQGCKIKIMKKQIIILLLSLVTVCKAQKPVYDIAEIRDNKAEGAYFKDINNVLNGYDGTYLYTKGNSSLKIALKKLEIPSCH